MLISSTMVAYGAKITTMTSDQGYDLGLKINVKVYLKSTQTALSINICGGSYSAQLILMVSNLQGRFQITDMTLETKHNVK